MAIVRRSRQVITLATPIHFVVGYGVSVALADRSEVGGFVGSAVAYTALGSLHKRPDGEAGADMYFTSYDLASSCMFVLGWLTAHVSIMGPMPKVKTALHTERGYTLLVLAIASWTLVELWGRVRLVPV